MVNEKTLKRHRKTNTSLVLSLALVLLTVGAAMAQTAEYTGDDAGTATITVENASRGETYKVVKLFDATVGAKSDGYPIAYTGTIPGTLGDLFAKDDATGAITAKVDEFNETQAGLLKTWAEGQTATASAVSDGTVLDFTKLPYGYYVVLTTQGAGAVTVTSTKPTASVKDKNTTEPTIEKKVKNASGEWVEVTDANINENVQYKIESNTANWHIPKAGGDQKQVKEYVIGDDLANSKLQIVSIDSIKVGDADITSTINASSFPITIPWATQNGTAWTSNYANGAKIEIIYTAKLTADAIIDTKDGNINTADLNWNYTDNTPHFGEDEDHLTDTAHTETYGIAFVKMNKEGTKLAGAEFSLPFAATKVEGSDNTWVYTGSIGTTTVTTTSTGAIVVKGLKAGTYSITETKAPNGYNQLAAPVSITAVKISEETSVTRTDKYWKYDEEGNKFNEVESTTTDATSWSNTDFAVTAIPVLNLSGTVLPSTGGIGTTMFYLIGGLLVVGAAVVLVARRKAD